MIKNKALYEFLMNWLWDTFTTEKASKSKLMQIMWKHLDCLIRKVFYHCSYGYEGD